MDAFITIWKLLEPDFAFCSLNQVDFLFYPLRRNIFKGGGKSIDFFKSFMYLYKVVQCV
ncbi:Uncharacterised protein [uncultured archaeon]|nr:Uncharacterised protein [uncultured archaeon]